MRAFNRRNSSKEWIRLALKCGLLITDAKVWSAMDHLLSDEEDEGAAIRSHYANDAARRRRAREVIRDDSPIFSRSSTLLGAIGIGVGLGMLLAPVSGEQARAAIRDKALDVKNRMSDAAAWASGYASSTITRDSTGTYGY